MYKVSRIRVAGLNTICKVIYMERFQDALDVAQAVMGKSEGDWRPLTFLDNVGAMWRDHDATDDTLAIEEVRVISKIQEAYRILNTRSTIRPDEN